MPGAAQGVQHQLRLSQVHECMVCCRLWGAVSGSGVPSCEQESGIAWGYDKMHLYGSYKPTNFNSEPAFRGGNTSTVPVNTNEHLMVWMKPAAKPSFRKLWAIIHEPIAAGALM